MSEPAPPAAELTAAQRSQLLVAKSLRRRYRAERRFRAYGLAAVLTHRVYIAKYEPAERRP